MPSSSQDVERTKQLGSNYLSCENYLFRIVKQSTWKSKCWIFLHKWRCSVFRKVKEVMGRVNASMQYDTNNLWLQLVHCKSWIARLYTVLVFSLTVLSSGSWGADTWDLTLRSLLSRKSIRSSRNAALAKNFRLSFKKLSLLLLTDYAALTLQFSLWKR